ncbi:hypothetical protein AVI53_03775 [Piscirickettsia salmonis]|uniref:hypothetical protein n=1 Tax=Piscirickettsia salmonis TaxID=1238 RepID=UPI0002FA0D48|nr:hypothetical protein [Piscirickettsia salmonis]ALT18491.1 hypothetical protein PSLF89_06405 [Piscirickettsia salmonis LF-89 = ATCC VR-1361]ALY03048.1 hypothetical protein AWE47_09500 [Piscirickettsia salmonis]AMA42606.1 hypothetical protein AWJ11_09700 [Piscirickettsia salmonis]AOS35076.1 hypothetical protein AVM72_06840 [Piscirickettsia salmonis]APS59785.1 hypothetical protein AVI53_03775 [Piscirickettsia salmonis]
MQLTDRNGEVFGKWLHTIKELTADEKVSFFIGKPHPVDTYPETSTRGCLERRCKEVGINSFDVTIMNMVHVTYIEASNCGMKLTGMDGKTIEHSVAKYQSLRV